jgi:membrane protease YdiL (CAAX protease family)
LLHLFISALLAFRSRHPWVECVVWLITGWLAILTATLIAGLALHGLMAPGSWLRSLANMTPNVVGVGVVLFFGIRSTRSSPAAVLSLRRPPWRALPWVALSSLCLALLAAALNLWIERILPMPEWVEDLFREALEYHTLPGFLGVFLFLVVAAPVSEELMFRGLFLHRLREGYGRTAAILGSALFFGAFHILPWQVIGATLVGIYLGWLLMRTESIFMTMISHALFNLVPVTAAGLSEQMPMLRGLGAGTEEFHPGPGLLLGTVLALAAGILGTLRATSRPSTLEPPGTTPASPAWPPPG